MIILILANSSGGLYDFRCEFLERLLPEHRVLVSLPDTFKVKELEEMGCEVIHTPVNRRGVNPREDYKLFRAYGRLLKLIRPDLVITYTIKPNIYGGINCRLRKIPYLATITGLGNSFQKKGMLLRLVVFLYRRALKRAACIFFQNTENKEIFEKYRIRGRQSRMVQGSGVNIRKHRMEPYPMDDEFRFLFVGRVMEEKGIEEFLEAAEALHSEKVHFQIVGYCEEDYQERLDSLEVRGVIEQLGFHSEVHEFMAQASAVVMATWSEGMSNVLLEASSTGRPVVAANISGSREVFIEGETGLGFRSKDSADLIRAIRQFMEIPVKERALMGRKAREKVGREFDRERVIDAYMEEVDKIVRSVKHEFI